MQMSKGGQYDKERSMVTRSALVLVRMDRQGQKDSLPTLQSDSRLG